MFCSNIIFDILEWVVGQLTPHTHMHTRLELSLKQCFLLSEMGCQKLPITHTEPLPLSLSHTLLPLCLVCRWAEVIVSSPGVKLQMGITGTRKPPVET